MRVIVLGGAGDVGSRVVEDMASRAEVTHVTIADRNERAARQLLDKLRQRGNMPPPQPAPLEGPSVESAPLMPSTAPAASSSAASSGRGGAAPLATVSIAIVDAFKHESLVRAIAGHDVCSSALGPFHLFEVRCARASIEAEVPYCSVCDDWNAAGDVIDKLDDLAKSKQLLVITGFGATPGVSNLTAAHFARQMDVATEVQISCFQPLNAGGGEAVLRHMLFVMSGKLPIWKNGAVQHVRACSDERRVAFPQFGSVTLWNMGHAEPVTMYRFMPSLRTVEYRMGFGFGSRLLVWPAYIGCFAFRWMVTLTVLFFGLLDCLIMKRFPKGKGALRVDVFGTKDGKPCQETMCGIGEMREVTGVSLAVGTLLLGLRKGLLPGPASKGGVYSPEGAMDPPIFLKELFSRGFKAWHDVDVKRPILEAELDAA